jgi:hypothetical protein
MGESVFDPPGFASQAYGSSPKTRDYTRQLHFHQIFLKKRQKTL